MLTNTHLKHGLAHCPSCETALVAPFEAAGKSAKCQRCQTRFILPTAAELFEEAVVYLIEREEDGREYDPFNVEYRPAPAVPAH
ncbi:MAG: hypothetical protein ACIAXF_03235 [Phycisphaerales bacterium JB063]